MIRGFLLTALFCTLWQLPSVACNTCGCGSGNAFLGMNAQTIKHYIALNHQYFTFSEEHTESVESEKLKSVYASIELKGGVKLNKRFQLAVTVPYMLNQYSTIFDEESTYETNFYYGIGDVQLQFNYLLFSNMDSMMKKSAYAIYMHAGAEFPTGKFNTNFRTDKIPAMISTGSGSYDLFCGLQYQLMMNKWDISVGYQMKYYFENQNSYQFGIQQHGEINLARKIITSQIKWLPYVGIASDYFLQDLYYNKKLEGTGAAQIGVKLGVEIGLDKSSFGINTELPLYSNIGDNNISNQIKGQFYIIYYL